MVLEFDANDSRLDAGTEVTAEQPHTDGVAALGQQNQRHPVEPRAAKVA